MTRKAVTPQVFALLLAGWLTGAGDEFGVHRTKGWRG